jgi:hypothetical protein
MVCILRSSSSSVMLLASGPVDLEAGAADSAASRDRLLSRLASLDDGLEPPVAPNRFL